MISEIHMRLKDEMNIVACLDNNQKGHPMKYQRFGKSNRFVKVTGCVLKKFYSNKDQNEAFNEFVELSYTDQDIPSPINMPPFEKHQYNKKSLLQICTEINENVDIDELSSNIVSIPDFSGDRVRMYIKYCYLMLSCNLLRITTSGCYTQHNKKIRMVPHSPQKWSNESTDTILKTLHLIKYNKFYSKASNFQQNIVSRWNYFENHVAEFIIPRVYMHDKITTDGYGINVF